MLDYLKQPKEQITGVGQAGSSEAAGWPGMVLDCMAYLVERLKLIVLVVLFAGVASYGLNYAPAKIYTSVAYLGLMDESTAKSSDILIHSAPVLAPVAAKLPQYQPESSLEKKQNYLSSNLHWQAVKGSDLRLAMYTLKFDDTDPHRAQDVLNAVLDSWIEIRRPRPDGIARLEKSLEASESQAADLSLVIAELKKRPDAMFAEGRNGYFPPNIVDLIKMRTETAAKIVELTMALRAGSRDLILGPPSLPEQPNGTNPNIIVLGAMATTFVALIGFFFLRWGFEQVAKTPAFQPTLTRMRRALPW